VTHDSLFVIAQAKLRDNWGGGAYRALSLPPFTLYVKKNSYRKTVSGPITTVLVSSGLRFIDEASQGHRREIDLDPCLVIVYDAVSRKLVLKNDRYASIPVYYSAATEVVRATDGLVNFVLLEKKSFAPDREQALLYLMFGYCFMERSILKSINSLHYASSLDLGTCIPERYWDFPVDTHGLIGDGDYEEAKREFIRIQNSEVKRIVESTGGRRGHLLFLSGGLDSRAVLQSLLSSGRVQGLGCATIGKDEFEDVRLAKTVCRQLCLKHVTLDFGFEDFHSAMTDFAEKFLELPDNLFATLPKGYSALGGHLDEKYLWLGTEPFSAYNCPPDFADGGDFGEDDAVLKVSAGRLGFLQKALAPGRTIPPSFLAQILAEPSSSLLEETGATINGMFTSDPSPQLFAEFTHKFRFKLWNFSRNVYERKAVVVTPLHSPGLLEAYLRFPAARRIGKAAFREANNYGLVADFPLYSKGVSFDYFDWLRHNEAAVRVMRESVKKAGMLDWFLDSESFEEITSPEVMRHNVVVLVLIRLYLLSLTVAHL
jgi:hypothetical protein